MLLVGCNGVEKTSSTASNKVLEQVFQTLPEATSIFWLHPNLLEQQPVTRPFGTPIPIIGYIYEQSSFCLYLQNEENSTRSFIFFQKEENPRCATTVMTDKQLLLEISSISFLYQEKNNFVINYQWHGKKVRHIIPFLNNYKRPNFVFIGDSVQRNIQSDILRFTDSMKKKEKILPPQNLCFDRNENCEDIISYQCDFCQYGHYSIIKKGCLAKNVQVCGPIICGGENQYACFRGKEFHGITDELCFDGSPAGFCKTGLTTYCVNNFLICK